MDPRSSAEPAPDAFSLYLQARAEWNRRTPSSLRKAIRYLEKAISMNGGFALASAALADCYSILMDFGVLSPKEGLTAARLASGRALHRGPNLAESLTSAALVRQMHLDWTGAEAEFQAAIEAHPGYAVARQRYGLFLTWMGQGSAGRREVAAARTLDPHAPVMGASTAWVDYYLGDFRSAARIAQRCLVGHPGFAPAAAVLALAWVHLGEETRAAHVLEGSLSEQLENVSLLSLLAYTRARGGRKAEAERLRQQLLDWASTRYVSPYYLAVPLMGLGRTSEALSTLQDAERGRCTQLVYLAAEPLFAPLRAQSEFRDLLNRLGLPAAEGGAPDRDQEVA